MPVDPWLKFPVKWSDEAFIIAVGVGVLAGLVVGWFLPCR